MVFLPMPTSLSLVRIKKVEPQRILDQLRCYYSGSQNSEVRIQNVLRIGLQRLSLTSGCVFYGDPVKPMVRTALFISRSHKDTEKSL
jgi:hypothetical protein